MTILIALLMAAFGFSFIYLSWKSPHQEAKWSNGMGWLLVMSSVVLLVLSAGMEFGIAYGAFGLTIIPLAMVLMNIDIRKNDSRTRRNQYAVAQRQTFSFSALTNSTVKNLGHFLLVVPISLIFSLFTLLLISSLGGPSETNRLTLIVLGFPFIWAFVAYLYLYSQRKKIFGSALTLSTVILCSAAFT